MPSERVREAGEDCPGKCKPDAGYCLCRKPAPEPPRDPQPARLTLGEP